jgi:hypothetical protein
LWQESLRSLPGPGFPELKIEDCKLKIGGGRFAPSFLKWKEFLNSSIFNRKSSIFSHYGNITIQAFGHKPHKHKN